MRKCSVIEGESIPINTVELGVSLSLSLSPSLSHNSLYQEIHFVKGSDHAQQPRYL